jgi:hypothetical protein
MQSNGGPGKNFDFQERWRRPARKRKFKFCKFERKLENKFYHDSLNLESEEITGFLLHG